MQYEGSSNEFLMSSRSFAGFLLLIVWADNGLDPALFPLRQERRKKRKVLMTDAFFFFSLFSLIPNIVVGFVKEIRKCRKP